jgi:Secretion system C-terminal sorting domain
MKKLITLLLALSISMSTFAQVSVTATAGTTGPTPYTSLKLAFDAIITGTHQGDITIGISANTAEPASAALTASGVGATLYTSVLILPTAANVAITGNFTPLINLNGAKNVTIDGRIGQAGTTKDLTISAITGTANTALQFINEATTNAVRYCTISSINSAGTSSGVIVFSTVAAGTVGNSSNTIEYCDIKPGSAAGCSNLLYSSGTSTGKNSNNVIQFNNFIDFYSAGTTTGITLPSNSNAWTIKGNSFYWTSSKATVAAGMIAISASTTAHTIDGNYIGGTAPSCGGTPMTFTGVTVAQRFRGISVATSTTASVCTIQNNVVDNIVFVTSTGTAATPGTWCGIYCAAGNVDAKDNRIGSDGPTPTITLTINTTGGMAMPLCINSVGASYAYNITGNTIAGIKTMGSSTSVGHGLDAIRIDGALSTSSPTYNISNNTIGSKTNANSIWAGTACTGTAVQSVAGISNIATAGGLPVITFNDNTIANLTNSAASSTGTICQTRGIVSTTGGGSVNGNTIRDLNNAALYSGSSSGSMNVLGIALTGAFAVNVNQNTIYNLLATASATASAAATSCTGIFYGMTAGTNTIERNHIYNINSASVFGGNSFLYGMNITGASASNTVQNNIIRLGFNNDNTANTKIYSRYYGINESSGTNKYFHNTIYIGGSITGAVIPTACAVLGNSNAKTVRNNIFHNARASDDVSLTSANLGLVLNASGARTISNNDYFIAGSNGGIGILGAASGVPVTSLTAWQTAIAADANSINVLPIYLSATDLHLDKSGAKNCGLINAGANVAVATDFDGDARTVATPTIGADEYTSAEFNPNFATTVGNAAAGTLTKGCVVGGWDYYKDGAGNNAFAINWSPDGTLSAMNATAKAAAAVVIGLDGAYSTGAATPNRVYSMKRYWNVNSAGTFDEPVGVRFFFAAADKTDVTTAPASAGFKWVKTSTAAFDPAVNVTPTNVSDLNEIAGATESTLNGIPYAEFTGVASFSGGTGVGLESAILAVEYTSINAQAKGSINEVSFATATEKDVKEFAIERSSDNKAWTVIGTKAAIGGTTAAAYSFTDNAPATLSYYRVRSIEANGNGQISKVVAVKRNGGKLALIGVSPVPTSEGVNVDFSTGKTNKVSVIVTDIVGKVVKTETFTTTEGANSIRLNLSNLAQGTYIMTLNDGETMATQRLVKN